MITKERMNYMAGLDCYELAGLLANSGYADASFEGVKFAGIGSTDNFCYDVSYYDDHTGDLQTDRVYVRYDHVTGKVSAEF